MERLVKFEVLGQEYPLLTDAPEEDIREILELVKSQIESQSRSSRSMLPTNKAAMLTSLNMAGKYVQLKKDFNQYRQTMYDNIDRLTKKIERTLEEPGSPAVGGGKE